MSKVLFRNICLFIVGLFCILIFYDIKGDARTNNVKRVLVIHSYTEEFKWTRDISSGIKEVLDKKTANIELNYSYIDTKNVNKKNYIEELHQFQKENFKNDHFDAIICVDNDAFNYIIKYGEDIFGNTPVVFCGINNFKDNMLVDKKNYTGVVEACNINSTIETMMKIQPYVKNIVVVSDRSATSTSNQQQVRDVINNHKWNKVNFYFMKDISVKDLSDKVKDLGKNTSVVYIGQLKDDNGKFIPYEKIGAIVNKEVNVAGYSFWDFMMGNGILGGSMISGKYQGQAAAEMVFKILNGKDVNQIPIIRKNPSKYMFDYDQLKKFKLDLKKIPNESVVINDPFLLFKQYKKLIYTVSVVITILIILIIILVFNIYKRRISERKLKDSYFELSAVYQQLSATEEDLRYKYVELHESEKSLKNSEERYKTLAHKDALTNLPNRILFMNILNEELNKVDDMKKGAVFFIDIDNFKKINDSLGHHYGDMFLQKIAKELQDVVGEKNVVGRFGGDEFLILQPNFNNYADIKVLAKKVINIFRNPFEIGNKEIFSSASIGISIYPQDSIEINSILKNADTAMYKAKESGKNKYQFFDRKMFEDILKRMELEKELREALNRNELEVYYQPQVDSKTEEIRGVEALVRWNSEKLGSISPIEFIPVAEETGLIIPMGKWIFQEACAQGKEWLEKGYNIGSIGVNISVVQLQHKSFLDMIIKTLEEVNFKSEILEIEITESVLMESLDANVNILENLKRKGINIALDDFGTGYSSLSYLRTLPIKTLKIDKSFIDNICFDKNNKSIVFAIIQLAHRVNLKVVAEGVETKEQVKLLRKMHCDYLQGYYYSKPLNSQEIEKILIKNK